MKHLALCRFDLLCYHQERRLRNMQQTVRLDGAQPGKPVQQTNDQETPAAQQERANCQWFQSVGLRGLTALVGIPIVLVTLWFGGWWCFALATIIAVWAIYELHNMMLHEGYHPVIVVSFALSILFLLGAMWTGQRLLLLEVGISVALLVSFPILFFRQKLDGAMVDWSLTIAIALYLGWPMSCILLLRGSQVGLSTGLWWLFVLLAASGALIQVRSSQVTFWTTQTGSKHQPRQNLGRGHRWSDLLSCSGLTLCHLANGYTLVPECAAGLPGRNCRHAG